MKQGRLAKTSNVIKAEKAIEYLLNRPKMEMVGLGLIYGHPGLGKTTFAMRTAVVNDYIYIRWTSGRKKNGRKSARKSMMEITKPGTTITLRLEHFTTAALDTISL